MGRLGKKRGRKPSKKTLKTRTEQKLQRLWLDCKECGVESAEVDGDVIEFTCSRCVQKLVVPPPKPRPKLSKEEKALRAQRKIERAKLREAKKQGITIDAKDLGFGRGWHRKALFKTEIDDKARYFSFGKEVTKKEYDTVAKERTKTNAAKTNKTSGWGRGWHLKGEFVAPTGDVYESGSLVKKAKAEPDEGELLALMLQHTADDDA
jgi:hypothetical protein